MRDRNWPESKETPNMVMDVVIWLASDGKLSVLSVEILSAVMCSICSILKLTDHFGPSMERSKQWEKRPLKLSVHDVPKVQHVCNCPEVAVGHQPPT